MQREEGEGTKVRVRQGRAEGEGGGGKGEGGERGAWKKGGKVGKEKETEVGFFSIGKKGD